MARAMVVRDVGQSGARGWSGCIGRSLRRSTFSWGEFQRDRRTDDVALATSGWGHAGVTGERVELGEEPVEWQADRVAGARDADCLDDAGLTKLRQHRLRLKRGRRSRVVWLDAADEGTWRVGGIRRLGAGIRGHLWAFDAGKAPIMWR